MMGEHKRNPTAIATKNGELPPKPPQMSKREAERLVYERIDELFQRTHFVTGMTVRPIQQNKEG